MQITLKTMIAWLPNNVLFIYLAISVYRNSLFCFFHYTTIFYIRGIINFKLIENLNMIALT